MSKSFLIVGLGNPGKEYQLTRHNFGFCVVDQVAREHSIKFVRSSKYQGFLGQGTIADKKVLILKPSTYMNNSGVAVKNIVSQKQISFENILVVCDDFHLDFGQLRLKPKGSDGGHNGLVSLVRHLGTKEFARLRMGIGEPKRKAQFSDFVLSSFSRSELKQLEGIIEKGADCCIAFLTVKLNQAMSLFNTKNKKEEK
ncbi:MAG: aminoacyl-tRNA hydrolase [Candidatus Aceula meridiana]|nr:aminoacyl-tRNA hydrolase [Candidatus Aceula meridiana]